MKPFETFPESEKKRIQFVLTDIDDTLTIEGRLPAIAFTALERLQSAGMVVIPITGRPAGWCDHIARMWPVNAVVGENGAFYFSYDDQKKKMIRRYWKTAAQRAEDREKLAALQMTILKQVPGCGVSADQAYREADLAIDFCEDVNPLPQSAIKDIVDLFVRAGAMAKVSSIHVNGWFGDYDKLSMTRLLLDEVFTLKLNDEKEHILYVGDSPNDEPMFRFFPHSAGVKNILNFKNQLKYLPPYRASRIGGNGFAEIVDHLLR